MTQIRNATKIPKLYKEWVLLKENAYMNYAAVKVFDGDMYSLINDHNFYEYGGCRHHINSLLYTWDSIYDLLMDTDIEYARKESTILLSAEQQQKWFKVSKYFEEQLTKLKVRLEDLSTTRTYQIH